MRTVAGHPERASPGGPRRAGLVSRHPTSCVRARHPAGFSRVEVLVVIAVILVLAGMLLSAVHHARVTAESLDCVTRLRQIGVAFNQYADDNRGVLPDPVTNGTSWEQSLARYLGTDGALFHCNADQEIYQAVGSSYDWRDTGDPATTLAGHKITDVNRQCVILAFEALPGWHQRKKMNAVSLDGSALTMDQESCLGDIAAPLR
jgi:type II secretory pathway pseudopilin PulG